MQFARDAVRSPRASSSALACFKRSTTQGFKFGLLKSAKRSGASTTSPLLLGLRAITGCALSVVTGPGPAGGEIGRTSCRERVGGVVGGGRAGGGVEGG